MNDHDAISRFEDFIETMKDKYLNETDNISVKESTDINQNSITILDNVNKQMDILYKTLWNIIHGVQVHDDTMNNDINHLTRIFQQENILSAMKENPTLFDRIIIRDLKEYPYTPKVKHVKILQKSNTPHNNEINPNNE